MVMVQLHGYTGFFLGVELIIIFSKLHTTDTKDDRKFLKKIFKNMTFWGEML